MKAWIFDVDGVITDLQTKQVTSQHLFPLLTQLVQHKDPVIFNTGRDIHWVHERVIDVWKKQNPEITLSHVFIVGEKGATWQQIGKEVITDERFRIPQNFQDAVHQLVADEFSDTMFFDENKKTMVSIEMKNNGDVERFQERREELVPALQALLKKYNLENLTIDKSNISTDIEYPEVGKALGMERILTWLAEQKHKVDAFYCFGDSPSDLAMGDALGKAKMHFTFVYVGDPTKLAEKPSFPVSYTKELYDKGTVAYIENTL